MPFYEYQCKSCGHELEAMQKVSDTPLKKCPHCGKSQLQRLMSAPVFRLKGGGWYETDFKGDKDKQRNLADRPDESAKESKDTDSKTKDDKASDVKDAKTSDTKSADSPSTKETATKDAKEKTTDKSSEKSPGNARKPAATKSSQRGRAPKKKPVKAKRRR
jgi:putative FmdB family regulatory protein